MTDKSDFKKVLDEHFFVTDSFRKLCDDEHKNVDDVTYVAFLRNFVFQLVSPERRKPKKTLRPQTKTVADLARAERLLKRLHDDLPIGRQIEFYRKCMEHLIAIFPVFRDVLQNLPQPATPATIGEIFGKTKQSAVPWKTSYILPLVALGSIFQRNPRLNGWEKAIVDVADYLTKRNAKPGRPEQRPVKLMSLALTQLMKNRTGKPHYPLVVEVLNEHFNLKVSPGYIRQLRPSKDEKKVLRQLSVIYQNRRRLHPSQFPQ